MQKAYNFSRVTPYISVETIKEKINEISNSKRQD